MKKLLEAYWTQGKCTDFTQRSLEEYERLVRENPLLQMPHVADFYQRARDMRHFVRLVTKFEGQGKA